MRITVQSLLSATSHGDGAIARVGLSSILLSYGLHGSKLQSVPGNIKAGETNWNQNTSYIHLHWIHWMHSHCSKLKPTANLLSNHHTGWSNLESMNAWLTLLEKPQSLCVSVFSHHHNRRWQSHPFHILPTYRVVWQSATSLKNLFLLACFGNPRHIICHV